MANTADYYGHVNPDLLRLIPVNSRSILEVDAVPWRWQALENRLVDSVKILVWAAEHYKGGSLKLPRN